ncbi:MAG TPA: protein kinase, partial [Acidimicrobiales bacterium]|nr:protein kinase [Acidimicrobiales bacterium]
CWIAHDEVLARRVVIAFGSGDDDSKFRADALALARVSHPHIVATYDTGVDGGGLAFRIDELLDADPLSGLRNAGTLTPNRVVTTVGQVAKALEHAHSLGLAHGRLNGDDVLVTEDDRVKIRGLGVAGPERDPGRDLPALVRMFTEMAGATGGAPARLATSWAATGAPTNASDVRRALLELDTGPDDATPMTGSHATPPAGIPLPRKRSWVPLAVFTLLAGVGLAVAVSLIGRGTGSDGESTTRALTLTASSFDPEARPAEENESAARNVVDGDPSTTWATERYRSRPFAGLKKGVGLILRSAPPAAFARLTVDSTSDDWAAEIYVADEPSPALAGWGQPVASRTGIRRAATFDLRDTRGGSILVWITDTGPSRRVTVREVRLEGRP